MNTKKQTSKEYFKSLQIIYYALIAGQMTFSFITFYLNQNGKSISEENDLRNIFIYIVPILVILGFAGSNLIFRYQLKVCKGKSNLIEIMTIYRSALIVRYALLEGPSLFSIVAYFMTEDLLFLGLSFLIILFFFAIKPTVSKAADDLELNPNDRQSIHDPNMVIAEIYTE